MEDLSDKTEEYIKGYKQALKDAEEYLQNKIPEISKNITKKIVETIKLYYTPVSEVKS